MPLSTNPVHERTLVVPDVRGASGLTDAGLLEAISSATAGRRAFDQAIVALTGELARRSDRSLGQTGLAARLGAKDPEQAIQTLTGATRAEAKALTAVAGASTAPWFESIATSVGDGGLSVAEAAAITTGLGAPSADVSPDDLQDAAGALLTAAQAPGVTPEALNRTARRTREQLESQAITDLEEHRRSRRSLTWVELPDGTTKLTAILDPESAAIVTSAIDSVLAPRRGGPRFVDQSDAAQRASLEADPRTGPQLALDTLVDIVLLAERAAGSDLDPQKLFGVSSPAVRVHVSAETLLTGVGTGWIEGQTSAISADTAARSVCTSGVLPILFRGNQPIDVGRTHRLHSVRQRIALAAQWGGCAWHHCTRPPAMTEVHHLRAYDGSNTTVCNGIPLCRFHHMQLHNGGWRIDRRITPDGTVSYWLIPPATHPTALGATELRPRALDDSQYRPSASQ
jgi:hypothetical protein